MTPASNPNEPGKMRKLTSSDVNESIRARLPHVRNDEPAAEWEPVSHQSVYASPPPVSEPRRWKFLPAFWTIASILSMAVNIVLIIILLLLWQMLDRIPGLQSLATNTASGLLGGLYTNFVKMDQANIRTNIHVEEDIPVQFSLNVSGPTNVTLSQPVRIRGARVTIISGAIHIHEAATDITLPAGVVLPISIENLVVPVDQSVPAVLDVPVDIPLSQTELHEPFVGLQEVVEPWYCLVKPDATVNGLQVCAQTSSDETIDPTLLDPTFRTPDPAETVTP